MTVYELRKKLEEIINQNKEVTIEESNAINFGDNIPISDVYEQGGRVYLAPPRTIK